MPISAARALCPEVVIIPPDPAFVQQLSKRILTQLYRFSPLVGRDGHEAFFVQLEGLEQHHPNESETRTAVAARSLVFRSHSEYRDRQ
jgi:nucleotidyltransferase/DNA polymerase involved in DNA repair